MINNDLLTFLDISGTILIIIGGFIITSKKAANPKIRRISLYCYTISAILWIPMGIMLGTWGLMTSQIIMLSIDIKGLINIREELKGVIR